MLEAGDKIVSPGIVSSKNPDVELIGDALKVLRKVYMQTDGRVDLVSADCGFAGLRDVFGDANREYRIAIKNK